MKKGQVAVFVIIAIILVAGIITYFLVQQSVRPTQIPTELEPVFNYYQSCIEAEAQTAISLASIQGGRIDVGEYAPGTQWAPFSSHLNFLGSPIPYWYYVAGNGVIKEQVPLESEIEREISDFVIEGLAANCDFEQFYIQGFEITVEEPEARTIISDQETTVQIRTTLAVSKGEQSARKTVHNAQVTTQLGKFLSLAKDIYEQQKSEAFLEKYAVDTLYSYAPVDGVEIQCAPKVWATENIINDIKEGLEVNMQTIKFGGEYYTLSNQDREYFVVDQSVDEAINVLYSRDWPTKIEITGEGVDDQVIIAEGLGTQEGLGAMGFCYIPYHFVYDVSFPVLIQIYNNDELFQFPLTVIVDNNVAREADLTAIAQNEEDFDLCEFRNEQVEINLYDIDLNPVDAQVNYECFNQRCRLGETQNGKLRTTAPACVNGFIHVRGEGFAEERTLFSSNDERFADIILEREYEMDVDLLTGSQRIDGTAIVSFTRDDGKVYSMSYPTQETIKLSEGNYEVNVYVYGDSKITIPASAKTECTEVPRGGLLGFFGQTTERCFDVEIPKQTLEYALIGGGNSEMYILDQWLQGGRMAIQVDRFPSPNSLDDLQKNFERFETEEVNIRFNEN